MSTVLEYSVETAIMALLALQPALSGFTIIHHDANIPGSLEVLIVRAIQGRAVLEGCQPYEVEVTMEWRSKALANIADVNGGPVAEAMRVSAFEAVAGSVDLSDFSFLRIEPEASGDRSEDNTSRHRQYKIPVLAKLASGVTPHREISVTGDISSVSEIVPAAGTDSFHYYGEFTVPDGQHLTVWADADRTIVVFDADVSGLSIQATGIFGGDDVTQFDGVTGSGTQDFELFNNWIT